LGHRSLDELRLFLLDHVSSLEQLNVLLVIVKTAEPLTPEEVAAVSGLSVELAEDALIELAGQSELVVAAHRGPSTRYRYQPRTENSHSMVLELADSYQREPAAILRLLVQNAIDRVRSAAAHRLADAFRLPRGKK
jgi:hypothetical protein